MKNFILFLFIFVLFNSCKSTKQTVTNTTATYHYTFDLKNSQDDKVSVICSPPKTKLETGKFIIPKLVPGYYNAMNFGQYISDFKAVDKNGTVLKTEKLDKNSWLIYDLKNVFQITYRVDDSWESAYPRANIAKSPGSMFLKDSVFVLNYNSLIGYFEELKTGNFQINITKPKGFYGSSALNASFLNDTTDVVSAPSYHDLVDAPILYCQPDTAWINVGQTKVLVSIFSKEQKQFAKTIANKIKTLLENQQEYLGGTLPVKDYAFLIYYEAAPKGNLLGDGLEHNNSTLCIFAAHSLADLPEHIFDVASHEFFHIITPLSIHSKEIQNYDYLNPVLSKHLWLYEGMTEYATMHMPIKQKMIGLQDFSKTIEGKIKSMLTFENKLPMTELSKNAMQYTSEYFNFYQKGALIGLCLDIRLRELSDGKMGTQELIQALVKMYGKDKAFDDDALFDVITKLTYPEIRNFYKNYVEGTIPLPLKETLYKVGFNYDIDKKTVNLIDNPNGDQLKLRQYWLKQ